MEDEKIGISMEEHITVRRRVTVPSAPSVTEGG